MEWKRGLVLTAALLMAMAVRASSWSEPLPPPCPDIDACVRELRAVAQSPEGGKPGLALQERRLSERIIKVPGALQALVPLLGDPDIRVAELASAALRDYPGAVDRRYLPQILTGLDRGLDWLPPILARIPGDDVAREMVARFPASEGAPQNQYAFVLSRAGARVIPWIVAVARCADGCPDSRVYYFGSVLEEMGPERAQAVPGLLAIVQDPASSPASVQLALSLLGSLQHDGIAAEPALLAMRGQRLDLKGGIDIVLVDIKSSEAGAIFASHLQADSDIIVFRNLAETGPAARAAGPKLVELLQGSEPTTRLGAARALGFIDYPAGADALVALLDDPTDVRLAWVAAESLGRLGNRDAIPALQRTARQHWYPPVREVAARAAQSLASGQAFVGRGEDRAQGHFPLLFFAYEHLGAGTPNCAAPALSATRTAPHSIYGRDDPAQMDKLAYSGLLALASWQPVLPKDMTPQMQEMLERAQRRAAKERISPQVALRVEDGWLAGGSRGEFGGEVVFLGDDGKQYAVVADNLEDLYVLGPRTIAVAGLAHMMGNSGTIYELAHTDAGEHRWQSKPWRILPGSPQRSWKVPSGELLIEMYNAGTILVAPDGSMRMAPCT